MVFCLFVCFVFKEYSFFQILYARRLRYPDDASPAVEKVI